MKRFELFQRVALTHDIPAKKLCRGDVATIVDIHPDPDGSEPGYSLEVQNAIGETIEVIAVAESDIQELTADEVLSVRAIAE